MYWVKAKWIDPLFAACNAVAPGRNHEQDGTIGDPAHMAGVSGHNPDDTPGVQAERQDTDSIPEVRAADVDARGIDMEAVVQGILHGPAAERDRLIYIIYRRRIWRKGGGWREEPYDGDDPHDTHAHYSGDPLSDEDGRPWTFARPTSHYGYGDDEMPLLAEGQKFVPITIPPVGGTAVVPGPADVWLNGGGDFWGEANAVALRIYCSDGGGHWTALPGYANGEVVVMSGHVFSAKLNKGTRILSVSRWGLNSSGEPVSPSAAGAEVPSGAVAFAFEIK